jgi:hypothetical protein
MKSIIFGFEKTSEKIDEIPGSRFGFSFTTIKTIKIRAYKDNIGVFDLLSSPNIIMYAIGQTILNFLKCEYYCFGLKCKR